MKFWILAVVAPGMMAIADSVWDTAAEKQHSKNVLVKSISVEGDNIVVTVVEVKKDTTEAIRETVELCSKSSAGGDLATAPELMKSDLLQQAFQKGSPITVQFSGTFNRCISKVKLASAPSLSI